MKSDTINVFLSRAKKQETKLPFSAKCTETKQQSSQWNNQEKWFGILQVIEKSVLTVLSAVGSNAEPIA
jgi:predicted DNA-binding protein (MmcQ/YjbR family)